MEQQPERESGPLKPISLVASKPIIFFVWLNSTHAMLYLPLAIAIHNQMQAKRCSHVLMCTREASRLYFHLLSWNQISTHVLWKQFESAPSALKPAPFAFKPFPTFIGMKDWRYVFGRPKPNLLTRIQISFQGEKPVIIPQELILEKDGHKWLKLRPTTHCSAYCPAYPWWCNWQECQLIYFHCFEVPFGRPEQDLLGRQPRRKTFWRLSRSAKKEAQACGGESNCPPWSWWPRSPLPDVWPKAHQKWSCHPAWSKSFGNTYLALQEWRPCRQKNAQKQWWHRVNAVVVTSFVELRTCVSFLKMWTHWTQLWLGQWKWMDILIDNVQHYTAVKLKHPYGVNSAPSAFKALCQPHWLCIVVRGKIVDICNLMDIKKNQASQRHFGQGAI